MATNTNNATKASNPCKMTTGAGILSYAYLFTPQANSLQPDSDGKYSTQLLIDKGNKDTLSKISASMNAAVQEGINNPKIFGGKKPEKIKYPIEDGDEMADEKGEVYRNKYVLKTSGYSKPRVVGPDRKPITDPEEVYSGCKASLVVWFKPYTNAQKGVTCRLLGVQKLGEGERLGGVVASDDDFLTLGDDDGDEPFLYPGETMEEYNEEMKKKSLGQAQPQAQPKQSSTDDDPLSKLFGDEKKNSFAA